MMTLQPQNTNESEAPKVPVEEVAKAAQMLYAMDFGEGANLAHAGQKLAHEYMIAGHEFLTQ